MANREVKFPCPVRRISLAWRDGKWTIKNETRVDSMTLPKSDELSEAAKKRGVTGFWYEAVDRQGGIVYRQVVEDPFLGMEVFDRDGKIRRVKAATHDEVGLEVLVPDVPELEEIHIYSSTRPSKHETEIRDQGKAEHVATISLRGKEGGGYGRK